MRVRRVRGTSCKGSPWLGARRVEVMRRHGGAFANHSPRRIFHRGKSSGAVRGRPGRSGGRAGAGAGDLPGAGAGVRSVDWSQIITMASP